MTVISHLKWKTWEKQRTSWGGRESMEGLLQGCQEFEKAFPACLHRKQRTHIGKRGSARDNYHPNALVTVLVLFMLLTKKDDDDNSRKGNSSLGRLGAILNLRDPPVVLGQKLMTREQGASVAVRTHTEEDEVKGRVSRSIGSAKSLDELLLIVIGDINGLILRFIFLSLLDLGRRV